MATRWDTFPIKLEGGIITNIGRLEQGASAPGSATVLQNFEADIEGGYTRVLGYNKFSTEPVPGTGPIRGVITVSENEVVVEREGEFYYSSGTTWTSKLTLTSPLISRITFSHFNFTGTRKFLVTDGVNAPAIFDTVTKTMSYIAGAPADVVGASRSEVFKSHLFFAKNSILTFAAPYTENDFTPANGAGTIFINDDIKGMIVFRDELIIFCLNSIYRLSGNTVSDFVLSQITNNTGCLCGHTIQEVGGDIMYLGPDGIRYLSATQRLNDFGLSKASEKIQRQIIEITNANCTYSSLTIAGKNQYRLFYYLDNVPTKNTKGFIATKFSDQTVEDISWSTLKGIKVYTVSKYQSRDREFILFSSETDFVYRMESGNSFDGEDIEAIFETPYMPITDPKFRKTLYKHTLYAKPSGGMTLQAQLKFDYSRPGSSPSSPFVIEGDSSLATYGGISSTYGAAVYGFRGAEEYYNNVIGSGFVVALRYSNLSSNPPFNLNLVVLEYRQNERR